VKPFVAIDFETADSGRDSACSVACVRVEDGRVVRTEHRLIRPPRQHFQFTHVHGIRWEDVASAPTFGPVWRDVVPILDGAEFLAAHHAPFDRSVLASCCEAAGLVPPELPFRCTVRIARAAWRLFPTRLPDVCRFLGIPLRHHDALSDAEACARIVVAAEAVQAGAPSAADAVASGGTPRARRRAVG
jgi:DNA polymerase III subunit epsilon